MEKLDNVNKNEKDDFIEKEKLQESGKGEKELLFSGGAGAACFFMGYLQGLVEIVGKIKLREYKLGGVSCGTAAAGYFYIAINSDFDMKYFYQNYIRKFYEKENRKYFKNNVT